MKPFIKSSNVKEIDKHITDPKTSLLIESKLFALFRLIDKKGSNLDAPDNEYLHGTKVIEYKQDYFIGFKKNTFSNGSFSLKTISLVKL